VNSIARPLSTNVNVVNGSVTGVYFSFVAALIAVASLA
jgi:hypothetical protein